MSGAASTELYVAAADGRFSVAVHCGARSTADTVAFAATPRRRAPTRSP